MKRKQERMSQSVFISPEILQRFSKRNNVSILDAEKIGGELVKFLTLCAASEQSLAPSPAIDEMWHHFILHTRDYGDWCTSHFGRFIHHVPSDSPDCFAYRRTRDLLTDQFGKLPARYWPAVDSIETAYSDCSCADCRTVSV